MSIKLFYAKIDKPIGDQGRNAALLLPYERMFSQVIDHVLPMTQAREGVVACGVVHGLHINRPNQSAKVRGRIEIFFIFFALLFSTRAVYALRGHASAQARLFVENLPLALHA